jgi:hypothetical protein
MDEDTKFVTLDLREDLGRDWEFFPAMNVVAFRRGISCEARVAALDDLQQTWKRRHLRLAQSA